MYTLGSAEILDTALKVTQSNVYMSLPQAAEPQGAEGDRTNPRIPSLYGLVHRHPCSGPNC